MPRQKMGIKNKSNNNNNNDVGGGDCRKKGMGSFSGCTLLVVVMPTNLLCFFLFSFCLFSVCISVFFPLLYSALLYHLLHLLLCLMLNSHSFCIPLFTLLVRWHLVDCFCFKYWCLNTILFGWQSESHNCSSLKQKMRCCCW